MGDEITIGVTEIVNNIEVTAQPNDQVIDINVTDNSDEVTLNVTPNVIEVNINKGSSYARWGSIFGNLTDQADLTNALFNKADLVDGKVPSYQLPSFVDDVIEVANYAALPTVGEIGKIYITLDDNKIYRWSGSIYIEIASNQAIWGAITGSLNNQTDLVNALNLKANDNAVVKLTGDQSISGVKSFLNRVNVYTNNAVGLNVEGEGDSAIPVVFSRLNQDLITLQVFGSIQANKYIVRDGLSSQFLKADGSLDSNTYLTSLSGAVLTTTDQSVAGVKTFTNLSKFTNNTGSFAVEIDTSSSDALVVKNNGTTTLQISRSGEILGTKYRVSGGFSSQFLKANGDLDSTVYTPASRTITINGVTQDLTSNRSFTVATHDAVTIGTANGLSLSGQALSLALSSGSTTGALSAADWTTFNNKQNTITNPITGSGTINFLPKFTQSGSIGNSQIFDNGTFIGIGISTGLNRILQVVGSTPISHKQTNSPLEMIIGQFDDSGNAIINNTANAILGFSTNNQRAMTILPNLNVGIGTTSPDQRLTVSNNVTFNSSGVDNGFLQIFGNNSYLNLGADKGGGATLKYNINGNLDITPRSGYNTVFTSGNVGIGTTSPFTQGSSPTSLEIAGSNFGQLFVSANNGAARGTLMARNGTNDVYIGAITNSALAFGTNDIERMRITSGGSVVVNNLGTGLVYSNAGALTSTNPSDERLKDEITDLQYGLNEILQLRPVSYNWKNNTINQGKQFGFIAQEVQEVMPELVKEFETEDGERLGLDKEGIYAALVNAIKELKAEIEILKQK